MSEVKFTKGDWFVLDDRVVVCGDFRVAYAYSGSNIPFIDHVKANAHLIAAAPEMYETLETIVDCSSVKTIDLGDGMTIDIESIKQLLAKARGES